MFLIINEEETICYYFNQTTHQFIAFVPNEKHIVLEDFVDGRPLILNKYKLFLENLKKYNCIYDMYFNMKNDTIYFNTVQPKKEYINYSYHDKDLKRNKFDKNHIMEILPNGYKLFHHDGKRRTIYGIESKLKSIVGPDGEEKRLPEQKENEKIIYHENFIFIISRTKIKKISYETLEVIQCLDIQDLNDDFFLVYTSTNFLYIWSQGNFAHSSIIQQFQINKLKLKQKQGFRKMNNIYIDPYERFIIFQYSSIKQILLYDVLTFEKISTIDYINDWMILQICKKNIYRLETDHKKWELYKTSLFPITFLWPIYKKFKIHPLFDRNILRIIIQYINPFFLINSRLSSSIIPFLKNNEIWL